jgi:uncharacterized protein (DUF433 family)
MPQLTRITRDPAVMGGKPCIRGMRVTVGTVVGLVAAGRTRDEILREYPYLEAEDIAEALSYAAWRQRKSRDHARHLEQPLRRAGSESLMYVNVDGHHRTIWCQIEQLPTVVAPSWRKAAAFGNANALARRRGAPQPSRTETR